MSLQPYPQFPETHWSLVRRAGCDDQEARREALQILLERYQPALRSYLRIHRSLMPEDVNDVLQAFITDRIIANDLCRVADEGRGRFRSFLLASLSNFVASHFSTLRSRSIPARLQKSQDSRLIVEADWTRALIHGVLVTMRSKCVETGRPDVWDVFEGRILAQIFDGAKPVSYEEIAQKWRLDSPVTAANLLVTAKRMYARLLRIAVAEYEKNPNQIDEEIADLGRVLSQTSPMDI